MTSYKAVIPTFYSRIFMYVCGYLTTATVHVSLAENDPWIAHGGQKKLLYVVFQHFPLKHEAPQC